jgi:hypothetical protein
VLHPYSRQQKFTLPAVVSTYFHSGNCLDAPHIILLLLVFSPWASLGRNQSHGQATSMALVCCILGKFLGIVCHCFPLHHIYISEYLHFETTCMHACMCAHTQIHTLTRIEVRASTSLQTPCLSMIFTCKIQSHIKVLTKISVPI